MSVTCTYLNAPKTVVIDLFVLGPVECRSLPEYIFLYIPRPFSMHFYGDNALLWPTHPALWSQLNRHYEHQPKIRSFFNLEQVVLCPGDDPMRSYSRSKTPIRDTFFQVFLQQRGRNSRLCHGYQTRSMVEAQKSPLHVCFFNIWTKIVSFLVLSATRLALYKDIFKELSTNMSGKTFPPLVW